MSISPAQSPEQGTLLTYSVLTGLTPMIPIPLVDDLAKDYFRRRLVSALASRYGVTLQPAFLETLTSEPGGCLAAGCLTQVLIFPLKLIFRKVFFFLEWKRVLDLTSQTYHYAYLMDCAFQEGFLGPTSPRTPAEVRRAVDEVCRTAPVRPIENAIAGTFRQSKGVLMAGVRTLAQALNGITGRASRSQVNEVLDTAAEREKQQVAGVVDQLQGRMRTVPEAHFRQLREQLLTRLRGS